MNNDMSFNLDKLNETYDEIERLYNEYKESTISLNQEIQKLGITWGNKEGSTYTTFKEKYDEKKPKLEETENLMKELLDTLNLKKQEIEEATISSENNFE